MQRQSYQIAVKASMVRPIKSLSLLSELSAHGLHWALIEPGAHKNKVNSSSTCKKGDVK